jgi:signal transduction histidine kinase
MPVLEIVRAPTFRLTAISASAFFLCAIIFFAFVYWQTDLSETREIDRFVEGQIRSITSANANETVRLLVRGDSLEDAESGGYAGLFAVDGVPLAGNLDRFPTGLVPDGRSRDAEISAIVRGQAVKGAARAAGMRLPDGRVVVIAHSMIALDEFRHIVKRALALGLIPTIGLALLAGAFLSGRALQKVRTMHAAVQGILRGNLQERLPHRGTTDDFDRLAAAVNGMLDEIERLLGEIKGVGDDIAHDLRTPLTRVRARLERGRETANSKQELEAAVSDALAGLDQALAIITALLRITELEDGRRRAAFRQVDLVDLALDISEAFRPIAEERHIAVVVEAATAPMFVLGDRDLLIEALANLIDNAIKFAPEHGNVSIAIVERQGTPAVRVTDDGPGIPAGEREAVFKPFYRSDKSRHLPGSGLGLGLVSAIVKLHNFRIAIGEVARGCVFEIVCDGDRLHASEVKPFEASTEQAG